MSATAHLPGLEPPPKPPRYPPPEKVVRELMALGVSEATARGYENRQAHAVLDKKRRDRRAADQAAAGQPVEPAKPRGDWQPGVAEVERAETAAGLWAAAEDDATPGTELVRLVEVAVRHLPLADLRRCAKGVARLYGWRGE